MGSAIARSDSFFDSKAISGDYPPIAEHGLIGDLRTAALVGTDGTIDWYCCPRFDSPERLRRDPRRRPTAARFVLAAESLARSQQFYFPDTNVLITRFFTPDGVGEIQDFMPIAGDPARPSGTGSSAGSSAAAGRCTSRCGSLLASTTAPQPHTVHLDEPMRRSSSSAG